MRRRLAIWLTLGATGWAAILAPLTALADVNSPEYRDGLICYVVTGDTGETIAVHDTFTRDADPLAPNVGSTSGGGPLPCLPTACPDGYTLVSTACWTHDPFDHIPVLDQGADSAATPAVTLPTQVTATVDVGPLVEPPIAG